MTDSIQPPNANPEKVVEHLKKEYMVMSSRRTHLVYAYLTLALLLGIGVGVGYVISNQGDFSSSLATATDEIMVSDTLSNNCETQRAELIGKCAALEDETTYTSCVAEVSPCQTNDEGIAPEPE